MKTAGYFYDEFYEEVLGCDVMPWLLEQSASIVAKLESFEKFPNCSAGVLVVETQMEHQKKVKEYYKMIEDRRQAEREAEQKKLEDKERRRINREAKRRAEEIARLKSTIDEAFVKKGKVEDGVLLNDLIDIDGYTKDTQNIGIIGGWLG